MGKIAAVECDHPQCYTIGRIEKGGSPDGWITLKYGATTEYFHSWKCAKAIVELNELGSRSRESVPSA